MTNEYLKRRDYDAIKKVAREKGFGGKDFSAALRLIFREWETLTNTITLKPNGSCPIIRAGEVLSFMFKRLAPTKD